MLRTLRHIGLLFSALAALLLAAPLILYWLGLSGIDGLPRQPAALASTEQQVLAWKAARGDGAPHVAPMNPYSYLALGAQERRTPAGLSVTWWVARDYLIRHRRHEGMLWWHLSGAALTIWLSRNWTSAEILSAASRLHHGHTRAAVRRPPS